MNEPRKTAESTGIFPPTPTPEAAASAASATNVRELPIAIPNMLPMNRVRLNDHLRKRTSFRWKNSRGQECGMRGLSTPDVAPKAPEDGADEQP
jgi:hypothetical protein